MASLALNTSATNSGLIDTLILDVGELIDNPVDLSVYSTTNEMNQFVETSFTSYGLVSTGTIPNMESDIDELQSFKENAYNAISELYSYHDALNYNEMMEIINKYYNTYGLTDTTLAVYNDVQVNIFDLFNYKLVDSFIDEFTINNYYLGNTDFINFLTFLLDTNEAFIEDKITYYDNIRFPLIVNDLYYDDADKNTEIDSFFYSQYDASFNTCSSKSASGMVHFFGSLANAQTIADYYSANNIYVATKIASNIVKYNVNCI
jgi:hypothetical protein